MNISCMGPTKHFSLLYMQTRGGKLVICLQIYFIWTIHSQPELRLNFLNYFHRFKTWENFQIYLHCFFYLNNLYIWHTEFHSLVVTSTLPQSQLSPLAFPYTETKSQLCHYSHFSSRVKRKSETNIFLPVSIRSGIWNQEWFEECTHFFTVVLPV